MLMDLLDFIAKTRKQWYGILSPLEPEYQQLLSRGRSDEAADVLGQIGNAADY